MFDQSELHGLEPDHLRILPEMVATDICATVIEGAGRQITAAVAVELETFSSDFSVHNANRLIKTLDACGFIGLASSVQHMVEESAEGITS